MEVSLNRSLESMTNNDTQRVEQQEQTTQTKTTQTKTTQLSEQSGSSISDRDIQQAIDKATGLLQTIVTDKISDDVIRKMPADEYLEMLTLLDGVISGSIDENI